MKFLIAAFWFFSFLAAVAQAPVEYRDARGKEFWVTFLPNYHNFAFDAVRSQRDSLLIVIASETPATGTIRIRDYDGVVEIYPFQLQNPSSVFQFQVPWVDYELRGYNNHGRMGGLGQNGQTARQFFHITADTNISVYAHNQAPTTSEASIVYPSDVLGKEYLVLSYPSDGRLSAADTATGVSTPSQAVILATEDNTSVSINVSATVAGFSGSTNTVLLNRGDSYLLQAVVNRNTLYGDLTGTEIIATKPVAVFAGHQRSTIPVSQRTILTSRDYLFEQIPPLSTWGRRFFIVPFPQPTLLAPGANDIVRVLASENNTSITMSGAFNSTTTLRRGDYAEFPLTASGTLTSDKPVLVAQYKRTSSNGAVSADSDPLMLIIPPQEQYLEYYQCASINSTGNNDSPTEPAFSHHYLVISIEESAIPSVRVDGNIVPRALFNEIDGTERAGYCKKFYYAHVPVEAGSHGVSANAPLGLYILGYGIANSYGYLGGMAFRERTNSQNIEITGDTNICLHDSAQLTATGGDNNYLWTPADGLSCSTCPNPIATPEYTTAYTVSSTDAGGCELKKTTTVVVHRNFANAGNDLVVCKGDSAIFQADSATTYRWFPTENLSCSDCRNPIVSPLETTMYYLVAANEFGCESIDSAVVIVKQAAADAGKDTAICNGASALLSAAPSATYQWFPNDGLSCGDCRETAATPSKTTKYYLLVKDEFGCMGIDSVTVDVKEFEIKIQTSGVEPCIYTPVTLHTEPAATKYLWSSANILSCTDCPAPTGLFDKPTWVHVVAFDAMGCQAEDSVYLQPISVDVDAGDDRKICRGESTQLTAQSNNPNARFRWSPTSGLSCFDCQSPIASPPFSTAYIVECIINNDCISRDTVKVFVEICEPEIIILGTALACDTLKKTVWLVNYSPAESTAISMTRRDSIRSNAFSLIFPKQIPFAIAGEDSIAIEIQFAPEETGEYIAQFEIEFSDASKRIIIVKANAVIAPLKIIMTDTTHAPPGTANIPFPVTLQSSDWNNADIRELEIEYRLRRGQMSLSATHPNVTLEHSILPPTWTVEASQIENDRVIAITLKGKGTEPITSDGLFATMYVDIYLGDTQTVVPIVRVKKPNNPCIPAIITAGGIHLSACFLKNRFVQGSGVPYSLGVYYSAERESVEIESQVGLPGLAAFELYDAYGNLCWSTQHNATESGSWSTTMSTVQLPSGVYFLKYTSGLYATALPFIILR